MSTSTASARESRGRLWDNEDTARESADGARMTVIGSWNLENLFRPGGPFGPKDEATYEAKVHGLAATIRSVGVDALAVQEVGDPRALSDLVSELGTGWSAVTAT